MNQYRDGAWIIIAHSLQDTCPVGMLEWYMELANIGNSPELLLFRGTVHTKSGEQLWKKGGISYTRVREIMLNKLSELGLDQRLFGLHSLRSGGASAAACAGVPDRIFKRHGRWWSENAKDGYVKDSLESRLSVSKRIGLWLILYYMRLLDLLVQTLHGNYTRYLYNVNFDSTGATRTIMHFLCSLAQLPNTN